MRKNKLFKNILEVNNFIFPFLIPLTYFFLFLETYSYIGALRKYILVDSRFFLALSVVSAFGVLIKKILFDEGKMEENNMTSFALRFNFILTPIFFAFYFILIGLENRNYPNYVFSSYHLQPDNFFNLVLLGLVLSFVGIFYFYNENGKGKVDRLIRFLLIEFGDFSFEKTQKSSVFRDFLSRSLFLVSLFLLVVYFFNNLSKSLSLSFKNTLYIFTHLDATYDDKMRKVWGFYYDYMKFVKENTPENATIVIPPQQAPWLSEGNVALSRYFLYPRKLLNGYYDSLPKEHFDYVLLAYGTWRANKDEDYGWPKVELEASEIIYLDPKNNEVGKIKDVVYRPNFNDKVLWGVIKVK